jgi:hypothetical protein
MTKNELIVNIFIKRNTSLQADAVPIYIRKALIFLGVIKPEKKDDEAEKIEG